jgi:hypothetical protein
VASPDLNTVLNAPGRLCWNPTNLATAFPHGGTALGATHKTMLSRADRRTEIRDEAFGAEVSDVVWCGENWAIACVLRSYDNDALATVFPNTSAGATSGHKIVGGVTSSNNRPGLLMSGLAGKLLFSPLDPDRVPAVLFYKAVPLTEETLQINLALDKRYEIGAVFLSIRHATLGTYQHGFLKDLTVS